MIRQNFNLLVFQSLILLVTSFSGIYGQPVHLRFKQMTTDDGLSTSVVTSILQDHRGFMWIGTADGLNRYDGFKFIVYRNYPSDSTSLADNVVQTLFEDHDKNLLIGTENGLCEYDRNMDCFRNFTIEKSSPLKNLSCTVSKIEEDASGNLWLATTVGLIYFDRIKNSIIRYVKEQGNPESLSDDIVQDLLTDRKGRMWVTTRKGLNLFSPDTKKFKHINQTSDGYEDVSQIVFRKIVQDKEGNIWIGSREGLFCVKQTQDDKVIDLIHYKHDSKNSTSLSIDLINSLFVDGSDNVWVGTENGGINLFDRKNGTFWHYRKDDYDPQSISNESIEAICQDRAGNLWFGTYTGGLNIAMKNWDAILKYQNLPGAPLSLSHNTVTCFLEDHKEQIWVGTDGGGLNLFDLKNNRFRRFNMDNSNLGSNSVLCLTEGSGKDIWLGTWAGGLVRFDSGTGVFFPLTTKNSGLHDNNIYAVTKGFSNDLWIGSFEHGLIHYQLKENKFTDYTPENSGIGNEMVIKILRFSNRRLLIGTTENLQVFSPDNNQFITYSYDPKNSNSLSYPRVTDILAENDTCVWVGTPDGLNRFNPATGSFKRFYEKDGLPNNFIKAIIKDNSGKLWVSTNTGICRYDPEEQTYKNFIKADGLQSNEFYERSALKTGDGELLMGGIKGFNFISPEKITENKTTPDIIITDFKLFNKSVKPGADNSLLAKSISETRSIVLPHGYSVMTFAFAVMDFSSPEKNRYAYMMENFDKDWIYPENRSEATYTNLSPGDYIFRVKGSNNDGIWNKAGTSVRITILPPWWDTLWFKFIFVTAVVLMFAVFYLSRVKQLKNQKMLLEETVALKTLELNELNASKDKFFSIIAHDLKNPFSTIIGFSELLKDDINQVEPAKTRQFANAIHRSAIQTLGLLENLLEWANSQRGKITFNPVSVRLKDLVSEEFNLVNDMAVEKNIELKSQFPVDMTVFADRDMIKTVLRNLLSNAIKFTHRNGMVELRAAEVKDGVEISVSDTGIGMTNEILLKLFRIDANLSTRGTEDEKGTGLGLFLCKEFAVRHGGKIWAESESGKGSTFRLFLPSPNTLGNRKNL